MSSYQFVNSLAQCYGQQARPTADQTHQAASPGADYYNPNAATAAATSYPPACYSPPQVGPQYPQHPYATPAPGHGLQPTMGDYTQLQPQRLTSAAASHMHHASPGTQSPGMLNPASSCKYADSASSTSVASPQDLSTTGAPTRSTTPSNQTATTNSNVTITSKSSGLTSPLSVNTSPQGKAASSSAASQNLSSPASSTSSTSSNEKSNSNNNNSKSGNNPNPPQIYPWMKRVHLGQSKYILFL